MTFLSRLRWSKNLTHRKPDSSFSCTGTTVLISALLLLCFNSIHETRIRLSMCDIPPAGFVFLFAILLMYELLHGSQRAIDFWIKMMIRLCCCICMFLQLLNLNENSTHPQERKKGSSIFKIWKIEWIHCNCNQIFTWQSYCYCPTW